jgi:hypothetical protein
LVFPDLDSFTKTYFTGRRLKDIDFADFSVGIGFGLMSLSINFWYKSRVAAIAGQAQN